MRRFGKKNDKKKEETSERMIIFKLNDGSWRWLWLPHIKTDRELIQVAQKNFQEQYVGAYDLYRFKLGDGEIMEIISKFSYEEIWKMWLDCGGKVGKDGYVAWGSKFNKDDEAWNKQVMIMSMLLTFREGKTLGTGDPELDKNLAHDYILTSLARLSAVGEKNLKKNEALSNIKRQIERRDLPKIEADKFKKIIASM